MKIFFLCNKMDRNHVTPLDQLPELQDLDREQQMGGGGAPRPPPDHYQKFVRRPMRIDPQAGMAPMGPPLEAIGMGQGMGQGIPEMYMPHMPAGNCIDIARHIQDCPICSKFYSSDKTVYIIIIVILAIICILLLKKVLDV